MFVSAVEKGLFRIMTAEGQRCWHARVDVRYRHGLDILVDGMARPIFISTVAKGLFPYHMVVSSNVLRTLLEKPAGSPLNLCCGFADDLNDGSPLLRMPSRCFELRLTPQALEIPDSVALGKIADGFVRRLSFIASGGGLGPFEEIFSDQWSHRGAFDLTGSTCREVLALLGCGAGSTPAGDDMLVGAASVCQLFSGSTGRTAERARRWLEMLKACQPRFSTCTTRMSCGYLDSALEGVFASHLLYLHKALFGGRPLMPALLRVKRHGSTSGMDTLTGVALACRLLARE